MSNITLEIENMLVQMQELDKRAAYAKHRGTCAYHRHGSWPLLVTVTPDEGGIVIRLTVLAGINCYIQHVRIETGSHRHKLLKDTTISEHPDIIASILRAAHDSIPLGVSKHEITEVCSAIADHPSFVAWVKDPRRDAKQDILQHISAAKGCKDDDLRAWWEQHERGAKHPDELYCLLYDLIGERKIIEALFCLPASEASAESMRSFYLPAGTYLRFYGMPEKQ